MLTIRKISFLLVVSFFLLVCSQSTAPDKDKFGCVRGRVYDQQTHLPISDAEIYISNTSYVAKTDSLGFFKIPEIETGQYDIIATKAEYESDTVDCVIHQHDTTEVKLYLTFNSEYWSPPQDDSFILFFRYSNLIRIDSTLAGKIQYRLGVAQTYDSTLSTLHAWPSWEFGALIILIPDSIFAGIDFEAKQFNYSPIDSICAVYNLIEMYRLLITPGGEKWMKIQFPKKYNMPILAKEFMKVRGVLHAEPNMVGTFPEGPPFNIYLEIDDSVYKFWFYLNKWNTPDAPYHNWEVHVIDNQIIYASKN